jgi:Translation elongation factors (GTPases)
MTRKKKLQKCPLEFSEAVEAARAQLFEAAAEGTDELMEKYLLEGELTQEETLQGLQKALAMGKIVPAFAGSGIANSGTAAFISFAVQSVPSPLLRTPEKRSTLKAMKSKYRSIRRNKLPVLSSRLKSTSSRDVSATSK